MTSGDAADRWAWHRPGVWAEAARKLADPFSLVRAMMSLFLDRKALDLDL
ncbi:hypothetical protein [Streptomyces rhizosphaerihabitans]|nr:hypothetical protein [Streptomyces rhizosphaerihabitans]MCT9005749.1 hypothetical protein [Streptomyces rhizosphaerihabitans]